MHMGHKLEIPSKQSLERAGIMCNFQSVIKEYPKLFELKAWGEVLLTKISHLFNTHYRLPHSCLPLQTLRGFLGFNLLFSIAI